MEISLVELQHTNILQYCPPQQQTPKHSRRLQPHKPPASYNSMQSPSHTHLLIFIHVLTIYKQDPYTLEYPQPHLKE